MTPEQWDIVSRVFNEACLLQEDERALCIRHECGDDETLISEVESLLRAHQAAEGFIENPIVENLVTDISEMPTLTGKYIGHYRIEKSIGRGGMGDVYLATDTRLDRLVALKRLPERLVADPLFVKRFHTEAKAAATIHHPNVATLFSVEEMEDRPFITMEYVDGRTLEAVTPPEGMSVKRFLEVFTQIADALKHAHQKGVTHRDIKPGNIMIAADGTPKILDFGLAQFANESSQAGRRGSTITQPGQILGTPSYMSPEQAQGKDIDHRTDIFSLGVVMYEAIAGRRPFTGDNNADLISNLLKSEPLPVDEIRPEIPGAISRLIALCMQKKKSDRPQVMRDVEALLVDAKRTVQTGTSTGSFARRLYKESRSAGVWLRLIPAVLVVVLAVLAWYYFSPSTADPPISFEKMTMRRLTETNNVGYAQISPDGKSLVFATFEPDGTRALWIRRIDDRNALQIVAPDRQWYWGGMAISPDSGQVFYLTADRLGTIGTVYRVSSLGGPPRKLAENANDIGGLSPDGSRLLFVRYDPSQIISINAADGSDEKEILKGERTPSRATSFRDPQFSKDGRSVFYVRFIVDEGVEEWALEKLDLDSGKINTILHQSERIGDIAVLPESRGLLITAVDRVSNLPQLFHISLSDGKKTRLTNDLFIYFGVNVDNEGRNIVVSQRADESKVWVGRADDVSHLSPLNQESNALRDAEWTPDGRIVYDGYENNLSHIWISDADGRNQQKLTSGEMADSQPRVTPDGRFIVFKSNRTGRGQIWRMDIDGGRQTLLTDVPGVSQSPTVSIDGQWVYFHWLGKDNGYLARVPLQGGPMENVQPFDSIPRSNTYYWAPSPDGKYIAHSIWDTKENKMKIVIEPVSGGQSNVLDIWPSLVMKWTPDSKSIIYRERLRGPTPEFELLKVDVATGHTSRFLSAAPESIFGFSYSRDGSKIALVKGTNSSNAVILGPVQN